MPTIRELRLAMGMTQLAFGKAVGASIRSVIKWERGVCQPDLARAIRIRCVARAHGLTKRTKGPMPITSTTPAMIERYRARRSSDWSQLTGQQKAAYLMHHKRTVALRADIEAGRIVQG